MPQAIPDFAGLVQNLNETLSDFVGRGLNDIEFEAAGSPVEWDTDAGIWEWYEITYERTRTEHRVDLSPMASSGATVVIRTAAPCEKLVVEWTCSKNGGPPKGLPSPVDTEHLKVLSDRRKRLQTEPLSDGVSMTYRLGGTIVYQIVDPETCPDWWPTPPWVKIDEEFPLEEYENLFPDEE